MGFTLAGLPCVHLMLTSSFLLRLLARCLGHHVIDTDRFRIDHDACRVFLLLFLLHSLLPRNQLNLQFFLQDSTCSCSVALQSARNCRHSLLCAIASAVYSPVFSLACLHLSRPSRVRGPVDFPPCMRHRPFFIADCRHGDPWRVRAPHLFAWGASFLFTFTPSPLMVNISYNRLPTGIDCDVFDPHGLLPFPSQSLQSL